MRKKNNNRLFIIIGGIIAVIFFAVIIKMFVAKEPKPSPSEQKSDNPSPNSSGKLTEKELEKYLLEKRLDLQKYFVFNLGELKTKKEEKVLHPNYGIVSNAYVVRPALSNHLTQVGLQFFAAKKPKIVGKLTDKNQIYFLNEIPGGRAPVEWSGEAGDKNIEENPSSYIIFEKNRDEDLYLSDYFENNEYKGKAYSNAINLKTNFFKIWKNKSEALSIIKTDPALQGKV